MNTLFKRTLFASAIFLTAGTSIADAASSDTLRAQRIDRFENHTTIKTINGLGQYPENYQGTLPRLAHEDLINNNTGLIKTAVIYDIPIIFSQVAVGYAGYDPFTEDLKALAPNAVFIGRTNVNAWEEPEFVSAVEAAGRKKLIMGGLWTDVCLAYPAIEAEREGYDVYVPEDVVGSFSELTHKNGMERMIAAGVEAITWNVVPAELSHDHARTEKLPQLMPVFIEHLFKVDPNATW